MQQSQSIERIILPIGDTHVTGFPQCAFPANITVSATDALNPMSEFWSIATRVEHDPVFVSFSASRGSVIVGEARLAERSFSPPLDVHQMLNIRVSIEGDDGFVHISQAVVVFTNNRMSDLLQDLTRNQHDKSSLWPMLSAERFMVFNTYKSDFSYLGKTIFLSGCGSGAEIPALLTLGADRIVAHDTDKTCIAFCRARFGTTDKVEIVDDFGSVNEAFDFVISRHVIEHVPRDDRSSYFAELCGLTNSSGFLILDAPNQNCPVEQHTELHFFHLLSRAQQDLSITYFEQAGTPEEKAMLPRMKGLLGHTNVTPTECLSYIPKGFECRQLIDIDPRVPDIDVKIAGTIRLVVARA